MPLALADAPCVLDPAVLFQHYDADNSGAIDEREFRQLAGAVHSASPLFPGNFAKAMHECDT